MRPDPGNMGGQSMRGMGGGMSLRPGSMIDFTPGFIKPSPAGKGHVSQIKVISILYLMPIEGCQCLSSLHEI